MNDQYNVIKEDIQNFASALNAGDIKRVLSFYSDEGIFMPEGFRTLKKNEIGKSRSKFLAEKKFNIEYENLNITINENYAFVEAIAKTSENHLKNLSKIQKTSRDFFVLHREDHYWKILRYIFNNV
jgi:ketosteroid isomerase-like protein